MRFSRACAAVVALLSILMGSTAAVAAPDGDSVARVISTLQIQMDQQGVPAHEQARFIEFVKENNLRETVNVTVQKKVLGLNTPDGPVVPVTCWLTALTGPPVAKVMKTLIHAGCTPGDWFSRTETVTVFRGPVISATKTFRIGTATPLKTWYQGSLTTACISKVENVFTIALDMGVLIGSLWPEVPVEFSAKPGLSWPAVC